MKVNRKVIKLASSYKTQHKNDKFSSPSPWSLCPVKYFMHGGHTFLSHGNNVSSSHNAIVHPRMFGEALKHAKYILTKSMQTFSSQNYRIKRKKLVIRKPVFAIKAYLCKHGFSCSWRAIKQQISVQSLVFLGVGCCLANFLKPGFKGGLQWIN